MKQLNRILSIQLATLYLGITASFASDLPACPTSGYFNNCFGTYTFDNGDKYVGEWKGDEANGQGTYTFASGDKYVGEFKNDNLHGQGTYKHSTGEKYVGEFKNGVADGMGINTWPDGSIYVGGYKNDKKSGLGIETYPSGNKYIGQWKNDDRNGQGYFIWVDGDADFCTYKNGEESNCSGKNVHNVAPVFKEIFVNLDKDIRKAIQYALKEEGIYNSAVDGLWGKDTFIAIAEFAVLRMKTIEFSRRDAVEGIFVEIAQAGFAEEVEPSQNNNNSIANNRDPNEILHAASGTGFYVSHEGHIITNHHVINGCSKVKVHAKGISTTATILAKDASNDLALLKIPNRPPHVFAFSNENPYPLQNIIVAGFPFGDAVSSSLKFTTGVISSLAGIGNNYSQMQIDAAIQPGNSGGPIIDELGNIVGVAVSKLDVDKVYEDFGVIPENTNFGIKGSIAKILLQSFNVPLKAPNTNEIPKSELSQITTEGTLHLSCWMTVAQIEKMQSQKVLFEKFN